MFAQNCVTKIVNWLGLEKIIWWFNCPLTVPQSRRRSSNLLVSKVTKDDAGNYTCAPTNAKADSVMVHVIDGKI